MKTTHNLHIHFSANYNLYVQTVNGMIGADVCRQSNQISPINDETPLLYFLSGKSSLMLLASCANVVSFYFTRHH